jgi:hypothetical protein
MNGVRTYRPRIRVVRGPRFCPLLGVVDWTGVYDALGIREWECVGYGSSGFGSTPKHAYDAWYREFLLPHQNGREFMAAYLQTKYPSGASL